MKKRKTSLRKPRTEVKCANPECENTIFIIMGGHAQKKTCCRKCADVCTRISHDNKSKEEKDDMIKKAKKTKLDKYGDENYRDISKRKNTCLERYGDENYNNRDKFVNTMNELYGVNYAMESLILRKKSKETFINKYNVNGVLGIEGNRDKAIAGILKKYGVDNFVKSDIFKLKKKEDQLELLRIRLEGTDIIHYNPESFINFYDENHRVINLTFQCLSCDNIFLSGTIQQRQKAPICRVCNPLFRDSKIELLIENYLIELGIEYLKNNRTLIRPYEIDFYLPKYNLAFEINGVYYHSEYYGEKDSNYHLMKNIECNKLGIKLIHLFEDEINNKPEQVKGFIKSLLFPINLTNPIIKEVNNDIKEQFFNENYPFETVLSDINIGLYNNGDLVSILSLLKNSKNKYIITDFYSIADNTLSFKLLFDYFKTTYNPITVKCELDIRIHCLVIENNFLSSNGFIFKKLIDPYFWYMKCNGTIRNQRNDSNLQYLNEIKDIQEVVNNGYDRVWDSGKMLFQYKS